MRFCGEQATRDYDAGTGSASKLDLEKGIDDAGNHTAQAAYHAIMQQERCNLCTHARNVARDDYESSCRLRAHG